MISLDWQLGGTEENKNQGVRKRVWVDFYFDLSRKPRCDM
jgi:hypothetical protein